MAILRCSTLRAFNSHDIRKSPSDHFVSHYAWDSYQPIQAHFTEIQPHEEQIHTREHRQALGTKKIRTKDLTLIFY